MPMPTPSRSRCVPALIAALGLAGALASPAAAAPATVTVANNSFAPGDVTIAAGESVTWNFSEASHNVSGSGWSGNNTFGKGAFTKTFASAGTFTYVCEAHPDKMKGTVTVTAAAAGAAPTTPAAGAPGTVQNLVTNLVGTVPGVDALLAGQDLSAPSVESLRVSVPRSTMRPRLSVHLSEDALIVVRARREGAAKALPSISRRGKKGLNRFALKVRNLKPGLYRLRIGAVDAAGNESAVRTTSVRIPKR
jgi:plastocyanin